MNPLQLDEAKTQRLKELLEWHTVQTGGELVLHYIPPPCHDAGLVEATQSLLAHATGLRVTCPLDTKLLPADDREKFIFSCSVDALEEGVRTQFVRQLTHSGYVRGPNEIIYYACRKEDQTKTEELLQRHLLEAVAATKRIVNMRVRKYETPKEHEGGY